ncbi:hypothetical protein [Rhizobium sp.]|uniref:hypothetical protein n=1 Tax=Rhizobium sp. TaxID=391 RepID=UPI0028B0A44F
MRRLCIATLAASAIAASGAHAQERMPFHVATFADSRTVSLGIISSSASTDSRFDFDVGIGLTEFGPGGAPVFRDESTHGVRVRCEAPAAVKVGGIVHPMPTAPGSGDWKQDLWKAMCQQPIS